VRAGTDRRALLAGMAGVVVSACTPASGPDRVRIAVAGSDNRQYNGVAIWVAAFAEVLKQRGMSPAVSYNSALGGEADRTELLSLDLLQVNDAGFTEIEAYAPLYRAVMLPFLVKDIAQFDRMLADTAFRRDIDQQLAAIGLRFADAALLGGMSGLFTAKRPVRTVADLRGMRVRAMGNLDLRTIEALGASSVQVAWEEVPQALQTGVAQGYFNPPLAPVLFGHGSQIDYYTELNTTASHRPILLSARWLDGLTPEQRHTVDAAVNAGHEANRRWARDGYSREMEALAGIGIEVIRPSAEARDEFAARVRAAYPRMTSAPIYQRALALAEANA
jgi:TRAP-type C4-dicarboxylate transport system substrate-binding protein